MTVAGWLALALVASCGTVQAGEALVEAVSQTAQGDWAGAEATYEELARTDPEEGLPALARFLYLTGQEERLRIFLADTTTDARLSATLRTRVLLQANREQEAADLIRQALPTGEMADRLLFAASVLERAGAPAEAAPLLLRAAGQATTVSEATEPMHLLLQHAAFLQSADLAPFERWFLEVDLPAEDRLAFLDALAGKGRVTLPKEATAPKSFRSLLASVIRFAAGDARGALANCPETLSRDPAGSIWIVHRIRLLASLGENHESGQLAAWFLERHEAGEKEEGPGDLVLFAEQTYLALEQGNPSAVEHAETLIRMRPFDPEPMRRLMRFYQGSGTGEPGEVPDLVGRNATNPQLLGQCGYVLATEGFPERALPYYDRALALDFEDPFLQLNRAACLTRLGRSEEAAQIYRFTLEHGHHGRPYHLHEILLRLWVIAEAESTETECLAYFASLAARPSIPWGEEIARETARLQEIRSGGSD